MTMVKQLFGKGSGAKNTASHVNVSRTEFVVSYYVVDIEIEAAIHLTLLRSLLLSVAD